MKSYPIIYQGDIGTALNNVGVTDYMILNNQLAVVYVEDSFDENILENIYEVCMVSRIQSDEYND